MKNEYLKRQRRPSTGGPALATTALALAGLIFAPLGGIQAWEGYTEIEAGAGVSDNITRVSADQVDETIATVGTRFNLSEDRRNLSAYIRGDLRYLSYLDDTYDNEVIGGLDSLARYDIVPERFSWEIGDFFGQRSVDPFAPITSANRENVNYFTTGPNFELPLGDRNFLFADARWSDIRYESSNLDNQRLSGSLGARHMLSESSYIGLTLRGTDVDYVSGGSPTVAPRTDFTRREAFATWNKETGRGGLTLDLGYTEVEIDRENQEAGEIGSIVGSGEMYRLSWRHELSAISMVTLSGGVDYSDSGNIFRDERVGSVDPALPDESLPSTDPFRHSYAYAGYRATGRLTTLEATVGGFREDYENGSGLNSDVLNFQASASRELGEVWRISGDLRYYQRSYDFDTEYGDLRLGVRLSRQLGRHWMLNARYYRTSRDSTADGADYQENLFFLTLSYEVFRRGVVGSIVDRSSRSGGSY